MTGKPVIIFNEFFSRSFIAAQPPCMLNHAAWQIDVFHYQKYPISGIIPATMQMPDNTSLPLIAIRKATRHDSERIGDLWVELMTFHENLDDRFGVPAQGRRNYVRHVYNAIHDDNYQVLVAEIDLQVVGYLLGYIAQNPPIFPVAHNGFIADLCVTGTCRRRGVGARLVKTACDWFRARGMHSIQLNVAHHNPISQAFWRKMGWTDYLDHMWKDV